MFDAEIYTVINEKKERNGNKGPEENGSHFYLIVLLAIGRAECRVCTLNV